MLVHLASKEPKYCKLNISAEGFAYRNNMSTVTIELIKSHIRNGKYLTIEEWCLFDRGAPKAITEFYKN